jgi:hypothetical protein
MQAKELEPIHLREKHCLCVNGMNSNTTTITMQPAE